MRTCYPAGNDSPETFFTLLLISRPAVRLQSEREQVREGQLLTRKYKQVATKGKGKRRTGSSSLIIKAVSYTRDGQDKAWMGGIRFDLAT